jgi:hypothetical protein
VAGLGMGAAGLLHGVSLAFVAFEFRNLQHVISWEVECRKLQHVISCGDVKRMKSFFSSVLHLFFVHFQQGVLTIIDVELCGTGVVRNRSNW